MKTLVNQSQTAKLVGCSRNNLSKMWRKEKASPGSYSFFSGKGEINISDDDFKNRYGDHVKEWEKIQTEKNKLLIKPKPIHIEVEPEEIKTQSDLLFEEDDIKPIEQEIEPKPKTPKQLEQDKVKTEQEKEDEYTSGDPQLDALRKKSTKAKYIKQINDAEKSKIELEKVRSKLVEIETLGDTCIGYLAAFNHNIMDFPKSIVDDFEAAMKTNKTRSDKIDIILKPICIQIKETISQITTELDRERNKAYREEHKTKKEMVL